MTEGDVFVKPLDIVKNSKGKTVEVFLKDGSKVVGKLKAFDVHINLIIFDATVASDSLQDASGNIFVRGDSIILVKLAEHN